MKWTRTFCLRRNTWRGNNWFTDTDLARKRQMPWSQRQTQRLRCCLFPPSFPCSFLLLYAESKAIAHVKLAKWQGTQCLAERKAQIECSTYGGSHKAQLSPAAVGTRDGTNGSSMLLYQETPQCLRKALLCSSRERLCLQELPGERAATYWCLHRTTYVGKDVQDWVQPLT